MLAIAPDHTVDENFGPSLLKQFGQCPTAAYLGHVVGWREPEILWADLPPEPPKKTKEDKKKHREWVRIMRPALGTEGHARLEAYYRGKQVDWYDKPGAVVLAGLHFLPPPDKCSIIEPEQEITLDLSFLLDEFPELKNDELVLRGTRDLLVRLDAEWTCGAGVTFDYFSFLLVDFKTTYTFDFFDREKTKKTVKTPAELDEDEQAWIYGLSVMQKYDLSELRCRWVYFRTEESPASQPVDFVLTRADAEAGVRRLVRERALAFRALIRKRPPVEQIAHNFEHCDAYGGCQYRHDKGDKCPHVETTGAKLLRLSKKKQAAAALPAQPKPEKKKARSQTMSFRKAAEAAGVTKPSSKPSPEKPKANEEKEPESAAEAQEPAGEVEEQDAPEPTPEPEKPAPKPRGRPPGATKAAEGITATVDGFTFDVAAGSAVGKQLAKASKALQAAAAAFDGE